MTNWDQPVTNQCQFVTPWDQPMTGGRQFVTKERPPVSDGASGVIGGDSFLKDRPFVPEFRGARREAQRHAALVRLRAMACVRSKAVSPPYHYPQVGRTICMIPKGFVRSARHFEPVQPGHLPSRGRGFSLSRRERAGVRAKTCEVFWLTKAPHHSHRSPSPLPSPAGRGNSRWRHRHTWASDATSPSDGAGIPLALKANDLPTCG